MFNKGTELSSNSMIRHFMTITHWLEDVNEQKPWPVEEASNSY